MEVHDWGLIQYELAYRRQLEAVERLIKGEGDEQLIFCSHPSIVTLGRGVKEGDVFAWSGETLEVNRGGRATYHGPNQIVVYPIVNLDSRHRDVHRHMRVLEDSVVDTLAEFGVSAVGNSKQARTESDSPDDATGVWIGDRKIASVGIGVRKWITIHGLALNLEHDPKAFTGMRPCGFSSDVMISLEEVLGEKVNRDLVQEKLSAHLLRRLEVTEALISFRC